MIKMCAHTGPQQHENRQWSASATIRKITKKWNCMYAISKSIFHFFPFKPSAWNRTHGHGRYVRLCLGPSGQGITRSLQAATLQRPYHIAAADNGKTIFRSSAQPKSRVYERGVRQRTVGDPRCGEQPRWPSVAAVPAPALHGECENFLSDYIFFSLYILNLTILSMRTDDTQWLIVIRIGHCVRILFDPDANLKMLMDNTRLQFS